MMNESLKQFLDNSSLAGKIRLEPRIVVQRPSLTPRDLLDIRNGGHYGPVSEEERICELEIGTQVIALGKIIRRRGRWYFKILECLDSEVTS